MNLTDIFTDKILYFSCSKMNYYRPASTGKFDPVNILSANRIIPISLEYTIDS